MLLTTAEASILLTLSERAAVNLLQEIGVRPIDLGGRRGLRWYRDEILDALEKKRRGNTKPAPRRTRPIPATWDKPVAEIMAALLPGPHGRQEKTR